MADAATGPAANLERGDDAPSRVGAVHFRATSVEADTEQGMWYLNVLDEPVHHTTEGAPVNLDWTRDGNLIGVELLGKGEVPRPARCGCADAERLYDELEQSYVSACAEREALQARLVALRMQLEARRGQLESGLSYANEARLVDTLLIQLQTESPA